MASYWPFDHVYGLFVEIPEDAVESYQNTNLNQSNGTRSSDGGTKNTADARVHDAAFLYDISSKKPSSRDARSPEDAGSLLGRDGQSHSSPIDGAAKVNEDAKVQGNTTSRGRQNRETLTLSWFSEVGTIEKATTSTTTNSSTSGPRDARIDAESGSSINDARLDSGGTSSGETASETTAREKAGKNTWNIPKSGDSQPTTSIIFIIVRDDRGGVNWIKRTIPLQAVISP